MIRTRRGCFKFLVAVMVGAISLAACDTNDSPSPTPESWGPCSDIPDSALLEAGLDPTLKPDSKGDACTLLSLDPSFSLAVRYKAADAAEWREGKGRDLEPVTIGNHRGDLDRRTGSARLFGCIMRLDVRGGYVEFEFTDSYGGLTDLCGNLTRVVTVLEKYIPPAE